MADDHICPKCRRIGHSLDILLHGKTYRYTNRFQIPQGIYHVDEILQHTKNHIYVFVTHMESKEHRVVSVPITSKMGKDMVALKLTGQEAGRTFEVVDEPMADEDLLDLGAAAMLG